MDEERMPSPPAVGGSSLLVIFAVLCLTVFALLSLSTVRASTRLSQASAEAVSAYYAADTQAESILAQIRGGEIPPGVTVDGNRYAYTCPISHSQTLFVEVEGETVLRWQAVPTGAWEPESGLTVWDGAAD
ncbi:MAG: hypothetical protein RR288_03820 [Oscillibacter sp.]